MTKPYRKIYYYHSYKIFTVAVELALPGVILLPVLYILLSNQIYNHRRRPHFVDYFLYLVLSGYCFI